MSVSDFLFLKTIAGFRLSLALCGFGWGGGGGGGARRNISESSRISEFPDESAHHYWGLRMGAFNMAAVGAESLLPDNIGFCATSAYAWFPVGVLSEASGEVVGHFRERSRA